MSRNYDTTNHIPYPRITKVEISYGSNGIPTVEYVEQMAVVDGNDQVQHIGAGATRHVLDLAAITQPVQIVHPSTGAPIDGLTMTANQLVLGILAFLRADQLRRDAEADAAEVAALAAAEAAASEAATTLGDGAP